MKTNTKALLTHHFECANGWIESAREWIHEIELDIQFNWNDQIEKDVSIAHTRISWAKEHIEAINKITATSTENEK